MAVSVFDLFSVGIGPSSSHTVGPMRAARMFVDTLAADGLIDRVTHVQVQLFGSLAATGRGHGSDRAVVLGLLGECPETVDTETVHERVSAVREAGRIRLLDTYDVAFDWDADLLFHRRRTLPMHSNGMIFTAYGADRAEGFDGPDGSDGAAVADVGMRMDAAAGGAADAAAGEVLLRERTYYSVGGGFVLEQTADGAERLAQADVAVPYPFTTAAELLELCADTGLPVSAIMLANETVGRTADEVRAGLLEIWRVMQECVAAGLTHDGVLPGGLRVRRRARELHEALLADPYSTDPLRIMDWVNLYALSVNEQNAAGGRIVTAPTNGAAGIIPAVLHYYRRFVPGATDDGVVRFLLTAGAIGVLYQRNASISGAEVGCQGEVGSACSMAAGALCEVLGGTPAQVENAAEIGMEHNLGLTCDPIGGLVQVPCIERNAMASIKAINAARIAVRGDGRHVVSLDKVIRTMRDTGADMMTKYKETSRGGLAVNVIEC